MRTFSQFLSEMVARNNNVPLIGSDDGTMSPATSTLGGRMAQAIAAKKAAMAPQGQPAAPAGTDAVSPQATAMAAKMAAQRAQQADDDLPVAFGQKVGTIPMAGAQATAGNSPTPDEGIFGYEKVPAPGAPAPAAPGQVPDTVNFGGQTLPRKTVAPPLPKSYDRSKLTRDY